MLLFLDFFLYWLHLLITGFNLFGWISSRALMLHRWCVGITLSSWLWAGLLVGHIGYCPLTDWHWDIKRMRGQTDLPNSFITYLLNEAGFYPDPSYVDLTVGVTFAGIVAITIWFWIKEKKLKN